MDYVILERGFKFWESENSCAGCSGLEIFMWFECTLVARFFCPNTLIFRKLQTENHNRDGKLISYSCHIVIVMRITDIKKVPTSHSTPF